MSVRGEFSINGRGFAVADTAFNEVLQNGTIVNRGTVANDSLPVTMAASPQQLLLASAGVAYVFDLVTNTLTAIPGATFSGPVSQAAICDDFFILTIKDSKEFAVSGVLDATDWITNGTAIVSVFPDNIVGMIVFQRQIWFYSDTQSVVYYDSGNLFPFDVNPNAFIEAGLAATNAVSIFNNSVAWLGQDARGAGKVWLASGYTPTRISNFALEFAIQSYIKTSTINDCVTWTYQEDGHEFLVLQFPTANATWCYDANLPPGIGWHRRGHFNQQIGQQQALLYWNHMYIFGKHLVGAMNSDKIYEMHNPILTGTTWTFVTDDGDLIVRQRRAAHISQEQKRLYINELQVYVESGLGPQPPLLDGAGNARAPQMDLRVSKDGGHTWNNTATRQCGQSGEFRNRVRWLRLGQARDWVFEIQMSDPIGWRITDGYINPPQAGYN